MKKQRAICPICGKEVNKPNAKYCSKKCFQQHLQNMKIENNNVILNEWLNNDLTHCLTKTGPQKGELLTSIKDNIIKPHLLKEQNHECAICSQPDIHNNIPLIFILDHIDGNWENNYKSNFRLICPNCNSQLETTKCNRGNGRFSIRYYYKQHRDKLK